MRKNYLSFLLRNFYEGFLFLKKTGNSVFYLSVFLFFVLHIQQVWGQGTPTWGSVNPPSTTEVLKDMGALGKITKASWTGSNTLADTDQILHMAELDFSQSEDYELKIAYIYKDPFNLQNNVDPAECKEVCYYIECPNPNSPECDQNSNLQRFCEPVPNGQFDFVTHIASKYGAVMATNGAFYDYFYNCVPGVKSYIKIDGHEFSKPNILNHRNEGALAFDFSGSTPRLSILKRTGTTLQDLDNNTIYDGNPSSYPNIMSGGHLVENGVAYTVSTPSFCNNITYPWSSDPQYTGDNNILEKSGAAWRSFACPTIPSSTQIDVPLSPTAYGYQNFFKCSNLSDLTKRKQLTCVDYAKYGEEFGGSDGLAKRSRTFIGIKNNKLYWFVADGGVNCRKPNGQIVPPSQCVAGDKREKGFTIEELGDFANKMGLEKLLNFDGGSSSAFYVNGRGILQFQYDPNAPVTNLRVGPQGQRLLQSVLMLVPKQKNLDDVYNIGSTNRLTKGRNIVNYSAEDYTSFIDLSPALDKINGKPGIFGRFKLNKTASSQILFSNVKDQNKAFMEGLVVGVGKMPHEFKQVVSTIPRHDQLSASDFDRFMEGLNENDFAYWAIKVEGGKLVAFDMYRNNHTILSYKNWNLFDGEWHDFMLSGGDYVYDCLFCTTPDRSIHSLDFQMSVDNHGSSGEGADAHTTERVLQVNDATHFTIGSTVYNGTYIASHNIQSNLVVQDFIFSNNLDNYYEYSEQQITDGINYGDADKEYDYLRSKDWNSDLYDEMHHNETSGDDYNTIFCFDEPESSKVAYAWYRGRHQRSRQYKAYGTYVNKSPSYVPDLPIMRKRRSVEESDLTRAMYHIVNEENGLKLHAYHNPSNNQGNVYLQSDEATSIAKTNKFLIESMGKKRFLISNIGVYTLKSSGSSVETELDFSPNDLYNYWDFEPGLVPGIFYIKHKQSGKYLTGGNAGANISLTDFTDSKTQRWSLEKVDEAEEVIVPNYYKIEQGESALYHTNSGSIGGTSYDDNNNRHKWLVDYVGAGLYYIQSKEAWNGGVMTVNADSDVSTSTSSFNVTTSLQHPSTDGTNLFAITIGQTESEISFSRYLIRNASFQKYNFWGSTTLNFETSGSITNNLQTVYNLSEVAEFTRLIPAHYEISSLAHQDMVATHSGNQILPQSDDDSSSNHVWDFHYIGLGKYQLFQPDNSSYFGITSGKWISADYANRKHIRVWANDDGSYTLYDNDDILRDNGAGQEYTFTNGSVGDEEKFLLYLNKHHEFNAIDRGYYRIVNKNSKKVLRDHQGNVEQYTYTADNDFKDEWLIEPIGNNEYLISNRKNFKSMDVQWASMADDANIWSYPFNKTPAQRWKIKRHGQGFYQIENSKSGKCLDVHNFATGDGANIKQLFCRSLTNSYVAAQQFAIEFVGEAAPPIKQDTINYTLQNHTVNGNDAAGIFPVTFNNEDAVTYGDYKHVNKSDLWNFDYQGAQLYTIQLKSTGKMLTVGNTSVNGSYDVVQRALSTAEEKSEQMWALTDNYNGHEPIYNEYTIASAKYPNLNLEVSLYAIDGKRSIHVATSSGNKGDWKLVPMQEPSFENFYRLYPKDAGTCSSCISLAIPSYDLNQVIQSGSFFDDGIWALEKLEDGYYRFTNKQRTDKVMSAGNQSTDDIKAVTWNANDNKQRWSIENITDGAPYRIVNKATSLAMYWPSISSGVKTQTKTWSDGDNKFKWNIGRDNGAATFRAKIETPLKEEPGQFTVSPNPSQGEIDVDLSLFKNKDLKTLRFNFHDLSGRLLYGTTRKVNMERNPVVQFTGLTSKGVSKGFIILNIMGPDGKVLGSKNVIFR